MQRGVENLRASSDYTTFVELGDITYELNGDIEVVLENAEIINSVISNMGLHQDPLDFALRKTDADATVSICLNREKVTRTRESCQSREDDGRRIN